MEGTNNKSEPLKITTMKVICIDNSPYGYIGHVAPECLKVGEIYTVLKVVNNDGYLLVEVEHPSPFGYWDQRRFIPCSDIDEMQLLQQRQELQKV